MAEGITMAHFTRPAVLAEALDPAEWEVHFRTPTRFHRLLPPAISRVGDLRTLDPGTFLDLLARGAVLYTSKTIQQYVQDELAIFEEVKPDLVIGDCRLSLCISAPVARVPFASIFNAYWSPYRRQPAVVPELPVTQWISPRLLNPLSALVRPFMYAMHAKPLNDVRHAHGLSSLSRDIRDFYTSGDLVLYADIPELVPIAALPEHHHFIGPCLWSMTSPTPAWWDEAMTSSRPKVFIALGSSGPIKLLPAVLDAVSRLSAIAIVATSGREPGITGSNRYFADLLPFEATAGRCAAVVSHGGSSGVYPSLGAGAPVLAIPGNIDTHLASAVLEASGAGLSIRVEEASVERLREGLSRVLSEARFRLAAEKWRTALRAHDTRTIFPDLLRQWFAAQEGRGTTKSGATRPPTLSSQETRFGDEGS
jgi:UDP:flavonoid glycosyltransferase YjiC (YdhE family)